MSELRTNQQRLWDAHMEMAVFGATPKGGMGRLALTDDDKKARDLFVDWSKQADCDVRIDAVGNIFARRKGTDPAAAPVMTGSHLDTQPLVAGSTAFLVCSQDWRSCGRSTTRMSAMRNR